MEACHHVSSDWGQGVALLDLEKAISAITQKMLGQQLRRIEAANCRANRLSSGAAQSRLQAPRMGTVIVSGSRCDSEVGRQKAKPTSRESIGEHIIAKPLTEADYS